MKLSSARFFLFVFFASSLAASAQETSPEKPPQALVKSGTFRYRFLGTEKYFSESWENKEPAKRTFQFSPPPTAGERAKKERATNYKGLAVQSLVFLGIEHGVRLTEEKTRKELGGPFFKDWFRSVSALHGWDDGNKVFTNWVAHPIGGSVAAFIFAQNNRQSQNARFGWNKEYRRAKLKQLAFSFVYSEMFELGPISETSLGNVGLKLGRQTYIDHVLTPTLGTLWSVGEDALDARIIRPVMQKNRVWGAALAVVLNPTRSMANVIAFRKPWYRHDPR